MKEISKWPKWPMVQQMVQGIFIGAANIVPGVSGATIALICGVFTRLVLSVRVLDLQALRLLLRGRYRELARHTDLPFLLSVFAGIVLGNFLLAKVLEYLFAFYALYTWAFFLGLIVVSLVFVGRGIRQWSVLSAFLCFCGVAAALLLAALPPAAANPAFGYLVLCGILGIASMMLPGLSGSYVLILLGNYQLVMIEGVSRFRLDILAPFLLGVALGVLAFARILGWLLKKYNSQTMALLCGFIAGSLRNLWPWKQPIMQDFGGKPKLVGYDYEFPLMDISFVWALFFFTLGGILIFAIERWATNKTQHQKTQSL